MLFWILRSSYDCPNVPDAPGPSGNTQLGHPNNPKGTLGLLQGRVHLPCFHNCIFAIVTFAYKENKELAKCLYLFIFLRQGLTM